MSPLPTLSNFQYDYIKYHGIIRCAFLNHLEKLILPPVESKSGYGTDWLCLQSLKVHNCLKKEGNLKNTCVKIPYSRMGSCISIFISLQKVS